MLSIGIDGGVVVGGNVGVGVGNKEGSDVTVAGGEIMVGVGLAVGIGVKDKQTAAFVMFLVKVLTVNQSPFPSGQRTIPLSLEKLPE